MEIIVKKVGIEIQRLRLRRDEVLLVRVGGNFPVSTLNQIQGAVVGVLAANGLPNQVLCVPGDWEFGVISDRLAGEALALREAVRAD